MRKKLKNQKGFTLLELMVVCILVILFTSILTLGVQFAADNLHETTSASEAQVLYRTLTTAISDRLRFDKDIGSDSFSIGVDGQFDGEGNDLKGILLISENGSNVPLISPKAYGQNRVREISVESVPSSDYFNVSLSIVNGDNTVVAGNTESGAPTTFQVKRYG